MEVSISVQCHLSKHRQRSASSKEAGGQLFGRIVNGDVFVDRAVGPNERDERRRYSFRSDSKEAQKNIEHYHHLGYLYIGEWHTHAEPVPKPSNADRETMEHLYRHSILSVSALLLLIRGTDTLPSGLAAYYYSANGLVELNLDFRKI
jgi:integrative and conjugative element protein (TIGR02256 family)